MRAHRESFWAKSIAVGAVLALTLPSIGGHLSRSGETSMATGLVLPYSTNTLSGGFWRIDGGFVSTMRVKNVLAVAALDVTPALFMADGTRYVLRTIHLPISGVATININEALATAPRSIASHISEYGSAALTWSYSSPGHVTASIAAIDEARSLSFVFPFAEPMGERMPQVLDGLWWKHDSSVTGFISLSNLTDGDKQVSAQLIGSRQETHSKYLIRLAAHSTRMLTLDELDNDGLAFSRLVGGIRIQYDGQLGSVQVVGGLANNTGYSANIPFVTHDMSSTPQAEIRYAIAGMMVGKPDRMMMAGFPSETTFMPYLVLRNTTGKRLDVSLQLNYSSGGAAIIRALPAQHIAAFEARQVDMHGLLTLAGLKKFNGSINLLASFSGKAGDMVLASGSVDQTGTYVFEVEPQGVGRSRSKYANYWGTDNGNDTMFTLWNPTKDPQEIIATFYYGDGSGQYLLPIHLAPQASMMIDMAMLIGENKPDVNGSLIPPNVREGSASFASAKGRREWITLVIAAGIYNVSDATCGGGCVTCCGDGNFGFTPNPIYCAIGESMQCTSTATDCSGFGVSPSWTSSNPSVMTVSSSGLVRGVASGSTTITALYSGVVVYTGQLCGGNPCPTSSPAPTGTAMVPTVTISLHSSGTAASTDSARDTYQGTTGTYNLGVQTSAAAGFKACFGGVELVGAVTPSNYTGSLELQRTIQSCGTYINSSTSQSCPSGPDTSFPSFRDDDPSTSGGNIYDLDTPGIENGTLAKSVYRFRANFSEYATLDDGVTVVSTANKNYFVRVSCKFDASGNASLDNSIAGDNQIGSGTTKTSWNLQ